MYRSPVTEGIGNTQATGLRHLAYSTGLQRHHHSLYLQRYHCSRTNLGIVRDSFGEQGTLTTRVEPKRRARSSTRVAHTPSGSTAKALNTDPLLVPGSGSRELHRHIYVVHASIHRSLTASPPASASSGWPISGNLHTDFQGVAALKNPSMLSVHGRQEVLQRLLRFRDSNTRSATYKFGVEPNSRAIICRRVTP